MNPNICTFDLTLEPGDSVWDSVAEAARLSNLPLTEGQIAAETKEILTKQQIGGPDASPDQRHDAARHLPVGYKVTVTLDSCVTTEEGTPIPPTATTAPEKKNDLWPQVQVASTQTSTVARPHQPETYTAEPDVSAAIIFSSIVCVVAGIRAARRKRAN